MLKENRPPWVHSMRLAKFTLGAKEPDITNVRCYKGGKEGMEDDVFVEFDLEWRSQQDVEIQMQVLGKDVSSFVPNIVEEQLAKMMAMTVGVEDTCVKGTLQLALRPLMRRVPIVGAVQVAFTELPDIEFTPTVVGGVLGGALNSLLPAVKAWLKSELLPLSICCWHRSRD